MFGLYVAVTIGLFCLVPNASAFQSGPVVAKAALKLPSVRSFVIQVNIPLPLNAYPQGLKSYGVVDPASGQVIPAQVDMVSQYPNGSFDIVQLLARVSRHPGVPINQYADYEIREITFDSHFEKDTHGRDAFRLRRELRPALSSNSMKLVMEDVYGHRYEAPLFHDQYENISAGKERFALKVASMAVPAEPQASLPHLLGVTAIYQLWSREDFFNLDLRIDNASAGFDGGSLNLPLGDVYVRKVELWLKPGYRYQPQFDHPLNGNPAAGTPSADGEWTIYSLFKPDPTGKMHLMRQGRSTRIYGGIYRESNVNLEQVLQARTTGFAKPGKNESGTILYSYYNRETARYFPQARRLPLLYHANTSNFRAELSGRFHNLRGHFNNGTASGNHPFHYGRMGFAHLMGEQSGFHGGTGIEQTVGYKTAWAFSPEGLLYWKLFHLMYMDRQEFIFNSQRSTPDVTSVLVDIPSPGGVQYGRQPFEVEFRYLRGKHEGTKINNNNWNYADIEGSAFDHQRNHALLNNLRPSYENTLQNIIPMDSQHLVRVLNGAMASIYLSNDLMAREDLYEMTETYRYSGRVDYFRNDRYGWTSAYNKFHKMREVQNDPATGVHLSRADAWGLFGLTASLAMSRADRREALAETLLENLNYIQEARIACTGNFFRLDNNEIMLDGNYASSPQNEVTFFMTALRALKERVYEGVNAQAVGQIEDIITRSAEATFHWGWKPNVGLGPGVHFRVAVSPRGNRNLNNYFCSANELPNDGFEGTTSEIRSYVGEAIDTTQDPIYLDRAITLGGGSVAALAADAHRFDNQSRMENRSNLFSLLQEKSCENASLSPFFTCDLEQY